MWRTIVSAQLPQLAPRVLTRKEIMDIQKSAGTVRRVLEAIEAVKVNDQDADFAVNGLEEVVYDVDSQQFIANEGHGIANLLLLVGRVADKLQIPICDAKDMVYSSLADSAMAAFVCGMVLEIPE